MGNAKQVFQVMTITVDENLSIVKHKTKLRKANMTISLTRHRVPLSLLRSIYHSFFQPHLGIWGKNISNHSRICKLQKIAVRLMTLSYFDASSLTLFIRQISCQRLIVIFSLILSQPTEIYTSKLVVILEIFQKPTHGI